MAFRHGKTAAFTLNAVALGTFLTSIDMSFDLDSADTTTFGSTWKSGLAGIPGGSMELSGNYDPAAGGPSVILWDVFKGAVPVTGLFYPGGNVTGQALWTMTAGCLVTSYAESSPVAGIVSFKATIDVVILPVRTLVV